MGLASIAHVVLLVVPYRLLSIATISGSRLLVATLLVAPLLVGVEAALLGALLVAVPAAAIAGLLLGVPSIPATATISSSHDCSTPTELSNKWPADLMRMTLQMRASFRVSASLRF